MSAVALVVEDTSSVESGEQGEQIAISDGGGEETTVSLEEPGDGGLAPDDVDAGVTDADADADAVDAADAADADFDTDAGIDGDDDPTGDDSR